MQLCGRSASDLSVCLKSVFINYSHPRTNVIKCTMVLSYITQGYTLLQVRKYSRTHYTRSHFIYCAGEVFPYYRFMRSVCPYKPEYSSPGWMEFERPAYSNEEVSHKLKYPHHTIVAYCLYVVNSLNQYCTTPCKQPTWGKT